MSSPNLELGRSVELASVFEDAYFKRAVELHQDPDFYADNRYFPFRELSPISHELPYVLKLSDAQANPAEAVVVVPSLLSNNASNELRAQMSFLNSSLRLPYNTFAFPQDPYAIYRPVDFAEKVVDFLNKSEIDRIDVVALEDGSLTAAKIINNSGDIAVRSAAFINPPNVRERKFEVVLNALREFPARKTLKSALGQFGLEHFSELYPSTSLRSRVKPEQPLTFASDRIIAIYAKQTNSGALNELAKSSLGTDLEKMAGTRIVIVRGLESNLSPTFDTINPENYTYKAEEEGLSRELMLPPYVAAAATLAIEN